MSQFPFLAQQYARINSLQNLAHNPLDIGKLPHPKATRRSLDLLASKCTRISRPVYTYQDTTLSALISLIEACAANKHSKVKILRVLKHYIPIRVARYIGSDYQKEERDTYLRAVALRSVLENRLEPDIAELLPKEFTTKKKKNSGYEDREVREFKES